MWPSGDAQCPQELRARTPAEPPGLQGNVVWGGGRALLDISTSASDPPCDGGQGPQHPCPWDVGVSVEPPAGAEDIGAVPHGQDGPLKDCVLFAWFAD